MLHNTVALCSIDWPLLSTSIRESYLGHFCCNNTALIRRASVRVSVTETTRADSPASSRGRRRCGAGRSGHLGSRMLAREMAKRDERAPACAAARRDGRRQRLQNNPIIDRVSAGSKGPVLWVLIKDPRRRRKMEEKKKRRGGEVASQRDHSGKSKARHHSHTRKKRARGSLTGRRAALMCIYLDVVLPHRGSSVFWAAVGQKSFGGLR